MPADKIIQIAGCRGVGFGALIGGFALMSLEIISYRVSSLKRIFTQPEDNRYAVGCSVQNSELDWIEQVVQERLAQDGEGVEHSAVFEALRGKMSASAA